MWRVCESSWKRRKCDLLDFGSQPEHTSPLWSSELLENFHHLYSFLSKLLFLILSVSIALLRLRILYIFFLLGISKELRGDQLRSKRIRSLDRDGELHRRTTQSLLPSDYTRNNEYDRKNLLSFCLYFQWIRKELASECSCLDGNTTHMLAMDIATTVTKEKNK